MMPVREGRIYSFEGLGRETFNGLPGMLADSLPDTYGRVLFEKWLALTGRTSSNPIETLCFLGSRCMGALGFEPEIHMQTLCGIAHFDYRLHHAYSYEQAFNVMRFLRLNYSEAQEMFRRIVFNVVVRNQDDHTKNISCLMGENGKWQLSPAYDMGYAYNPKGGWTATHQMSINGKFDEITRTDLLELAKQNSNKNASSIIDEIRETASQWPELAKNCGVPPTLTNTIATNMLLTL